MIARRSFWLCSGTGTTGSQVKKNNITHDPVSIQPSPLFGDRSRASYSGHFYF